MGEPLYGFQTPNGYSDTAESWVNTGGLLERLNFGLSLASNRIPGTRVELSRFIDTPAGGKPLDQTQITDRVLNLIVGGEISPKTKEALMRQLNEKTFVALANKETAADEQTGGGAMMNRQTRRQERQQLARGDANITDPVTRIVGLILGSPEFQRQ